MGFRGKSRETLRKKTHITGNLVSECARLSLNLCISAGGGQHPQQPHQPWCCKAGFRETTVNIYNVGLLIRRLTLPVSYGKILIFFPLLKQQLDIKLKNNVNLHFLLIGELLAPNG